MIQFDVQDLKAYVEANPRLVRLKWGEQNGKKYGVIKYTRQAMIDWDWSNPLLRVARGLVIDENWNIVSRAFDKCFDYDSSVRIDPNEVVTAFKKINGFLAVVSINYVGEVVVSTTGTVDSDYVQKINDYFDPIADYFAGGATYMFECVHPTDPHIVVEKEGLHLIGVRTHWNNELLFPHEIDRFFKESGLGKVGIHPPIIRRAPFQEILADLQSDGGEGFMIHRDNGELFKLKSPGYRISKKLARAGLGRLENWTKSIYDWESFLIDNGCSEDPMWLDTWCDVYEEIILKTPAVFHSKTEQERLEMIRDIQNPLWRY